MWFRTSKKRSCTPTSRQRRSKPRVWRLEDRLAPAVLTVNSLADTVSATYATLDLREAILLVNSGGTATDTSGASLSAAKAGQINTSTPFGTNDKIQFDSSILNVLGNPTIALSAGVLDITQSVVFIGPGSSRLALSGASTSSGGVTTYSQIFHIASGATVYVSGGLTFENAQSSGTGGAIYNAGALELDGCTFRSNVAFPDATGFAYGGAIDNAGQLVVNGDVFDSNIVNGYGGAIYNSGSLSIFNSDISNSSATVNTFGFAEGGAIYNRGTLTINDSQLFGNKAPAATGQEGDGGALYNVGTASFTASTLSSNSAAGNGGGIINGDANSNTAGSLTMSDSTVYGNSALFGGGLSNAQGSVSLTSCTIAGNSAYAGGGVYNSGAGLSLDNTLIAGNTVSPSPALPGGAPYAADFYGGVAAASAYNLIGDGSSLVGGTIYNGDANHNQVGTSSSPINAQLGPLAGNGGPTQTVALSLGSPGINTGDPAQVGIPDQRGVIRLAGQVDIGAFDQPLTSAGLQTAVNSLPASGQLQLSAPSDASLSAVISAVNGLTPPGSPVTINVSMAGGTTYGDIAAYPPANVTLALIGTSQRIFIAGNSPALTVGSGNVIVENATLTTSTASPTILVTGGNLMLRNTDVEESTGSNQAAIGLQGGTLDLGTATAPGGNTLDVNGAGLFVSNVTATQVVAVGDTFEINTATVTAPQAAAYSYSLPENSALTVSILGLLANDIDPNGHPLTAVLASSAAHGTVQLNMDGSFTYTPNGNYAGPDSFTYQAQASDGSLSAPATVSLDVQVVASQLVIAGLPASTERLVSQSFTVTAEDSSGRIATDYTGTVHFTSSDPQAVLPADYTFTAGDGGSHLFTPGVTLATIGNQTVAAADVGEGSIAGETPISVTPTVVSWTGAAGDNNWDTAGNWSDNAVPGSLDAVVVDLGNQNSFTVTHSSATADTVYSITSQDALVVSGGTLAVIGASTINNTLTVIGGTFGGSGDITIGGMFTLSGMLSGGGHLTAAGGADLSGPDYLSGYTLTVPAGQTATLEDITSLENGAVLDNRGILTVTGTGRYGYTAISDYDGSGVLLTNEGIIYTSQSSELNVPIDSTGDIVANSGSLSLGDPVQDSSTLNGRIDTSNAAQLKFQGTVTLAPTAVVNANAVTFWYCTAQVAGSYGATSTLLYGSNVTMTGTVTALGALNDGGTLDLTGATLAAGSTDLPSVILTGNLRAAANWNVSGPTSLSGFLDANGGSGSLTAGGGADFAGRLDVVGYTLTVPTGQAATLENTVYLRTGSVLDNQGTMTVSGTLHYYDDPNVLLKNEGTIYANAGSVFDVLIDSPGDFSATGGNLPLINPSQIASTFGGRIDGTNANELEFTGPVNTTSTSALNATTVSWSLGDDEVAGSYRTTGTVLYGSNVTMTGTVTALGALDLGGVLDLTGATLASGSTNLPSLTVSNGALRAAANWVVDGPVILQGGLGSAGGSGSLTAAGGADLEGRNARLSGYTLVIPQGQTATVDDITHLDDGSVLDNQGTLILTGSTGGYGYAALVDDGSPALLKNDGTIYTNDTSYLNVPIESTGDIVANSGSLSLGDPAQGTSVLSGCIDTSNAAQLQFQGTVTLTPTSVVNASAVAFWFCTAQVAGSYNAGDTLLYVSDVMMTGSVGGLGSAVLPASVHGSYADQGLIPPNMPGGINLAGASTVLDLSGAELAPAATDLVGLSISQATLRAAADWTVSGPTSFNDGGLDAHGGAGVLTAAGGANAPGSMGLDGYTFILPAGQTATLDARTYLEYGSVLDNQGTLLMDGTMYGSGDPTLNGLLKNEGTVHTSGNALLATSIDSTGEIIADSGSLVLGQNAPYGSTSIFGGLVDASNAASLTFFGSVTLVPSATVLASMLSFGDGSLDLQLGGPNAGAGYPQIQASSALTLGIPLQLELVNGFTPALGEQFTIIQDQGGSPTTDFAGLGEGGTITVAGYQFTISYLGGQNQQDVTLTVTQVPATLTTLTSSVNPSLLGQAVTFTAAVSAVSPNLPKPAGSVDFVDVTTNTDLGTTDLSNGSASVTTSALGAGFHDIEAVYAGEGIFQGSTGTLTQQVEYAFSGFLPPLSQNMAFALNRTIPIKFQLADASGAAITSPGAITSLQIQALDANGNPTGTPFNPTASGGTALRYDGSEYIFNWQTKGLATGSYQILLALADGTTKVHVLRLVTSNASSGLVIDGNSGAGSTSGALLGGDVSLYVDNSNGDLTPDELARINDAVAAVDGTIAPYGVTITEVSDPALADVTLSIDSTSPVGGYADGVLGCTTDSGQVTIIAGWNFYAGSDAAQIGTGQYDFQTVVTHELGHVLGLGHSSDATSVMYATLDTGSIKRALVTADLNVTDTDGGACGLHAGQPPSGAALNLPATVAVSPGMQAGYGAVLADWLFAGLAGGVPKTNAALLDEPAVRSGSGGFVVPTASVAAAERSTLDGGLATWETADEPGLSGDGLFAQFGQASDMALGELMDIKGLVSRSPLGSR